MKPANYYYRDKEGREIGPFDFDTLSKFRLADVINSDTPVRTADSTEWKPCREVVSLPAPASVAPTTQAPGQKSSKGMVIALIVVVIAGIVITNSGRQPAGQAEQLLRDQVASESKEQIKLVNFKKTDGQELQENGVRGYKMDYEAEIEFEADGFWLAHDILNHSHSGLTFSFSAGQGRENVFNRLVDDAAGATQVHKGDRVKVTGVLIGEKKESGWKFETGSSQIVAGSLVRSPAETAQGRAVASLKEKWSKVEHAEEAEQSFRKQLEPELRRQQITIASFKAISGQPGSETNSLNTVVENYKVTFEAELQYETDQTGHGLDVHRGDRAKYGGAMIGTNAAGGWTFGHPVESHLVSASNPALFTQLKAARQSAQANACINNLRQIDGAKDQWAIEHRKMTGDQPAWNDVSPYIRGGQPTCPAGGTYSLNAVGTNPVCSLGDTVSPQHVLP